jgi:eukaryotic-like serine/threonine-protein kinase
VSSLAHALPTRELVLDRYRAVRPLGSGGNGSVWLAKDELTGLDVALKIIPREGKAAARAEREALAARRLRHPRCVRAYDVGHDGGHVYIAYEYVPGRTVREALRGDQVSDLEAVEIAAQVLEALAHAHRTGIVHRDVKPSNILLEHTDDIAAKLLDFGLAQFDGADTLTAVGDVPGTLAYIAPERLAGDDATPASDVWAVGVVLWEALTGEHPFWGMPLQEVAVAIERGAPPLGTRRPDLPRRLLGAVDGALAPQPSARPHASALAAELRNAFRRPQSRTASRRARAEPSVRAIPLDIRRQIPATSLLARGVPAALAATAAAVGVTLLPFWPTSLAVVIVAAAAAAAALSPRLGLAVALAAPIFPLGNEAQGAAILYGAFALAWLVLFWRETRLGLLFVVGPLLAVFGALALVPLAVQPLRTPARKAAQAALAVLSAGLVAALAGERLPVGGVRLSSPEIAPGDSPTEIAVGLWGSLAAEPVFPVAALVAATAAVALPWARRRSRAGVAALGTAIVVCATAAGAGIAAVALLVAVWGLAAALSARTGR